MKLKVGLSHRTQSTLYTVLAGIGLSLALVGVRLTAKHASPDSWYNRKVVPQAIEMREQLRHTTAFGPFINRNWPQESQARTTCCTFVSIEDAAKQGF